MSNTQTPISDQDLHAWVDGELDPVRRTEVEAWLAGHPEDVARVRDYQAIGQRLHEHFDPILSEHVEARSARTTLARRGFQVLPVLARAAAVAGLVLLGWLLRGAPPASPQVAAPHLPPPSLPVQADLMQPAVFAHQVYATDAKRPVEVPAVQRASLNRWVSKRMHTELRAPDLSGIDLRFIGGRLLPSTNRMAAQFMYEDAGGARITVYVRRIGGARETGVRYSEREALHAFYWIDGSMGYAVIGEQPAAELVAIADAVRNAFAAGATAGSAG